MSRFVVVFMLAADAALSVAQSSGRKAIEQNYAATAVAYIRGDLAKMESFYAPNYRLVDIYGRTMSRHQAMNSFKVQRATLNIVKLTRKVTSFSIKGDEAIAMIDGDLKATTKRVPIHHVEVINKRKDVWVKDRSFWILESTINISSSQLVDGKPMRVLKR